MVQDFMGMGEDPKPGLEFVGKCIEIKRKDNAENLLQVCKKIQLCNRNS